MMVAATVAAIVPLVKTMLQTVLAPLVTVRAAAPALNANPVGNAPPCKVKGAAPQVNTAVAAALPAMRAAKLTVVPDARAPAPPDADATAALPRKSINLGTATAASIARIAITTISSINVKPDTDRIAMPQLAPMMVAAAVAAIVPLVKTTLQ